MLHLIVLVLVDVLVVLALAVVLSSYERRCMSFVHQRDGPTVYMLLGMGQPIVDGAKLLLKGLSSTHGVHVGASLAIMTCVCSCILLTSCICGAPTNYWYSQQQQMLPLLVVLLVLGISELTTSNHMLSRYSVLATARMLLVMLAVEIVWYGILSIATTTGMHASYDTGILSSGTHMLATAFPVVALYMMCAAVEVSLHPHDILEAEPELVSGYYVDHGGVLFMLIYLGDGVAMIVLLATALAWWCTGYSCTPISYTVSIWCTLCSLLLLRYASCRYRVADSVSILVYGVLVVSGSWCVPSILFFFF
nr:NADH dehydrogenase subunit 1 [Rhynchopus humris]